MRETVAMWGNELVEAVTMLKKKKKKCKKMDIRGVCMSHTWEMLESKLSRTIRKLDRTL
jgi:hypothetical protein